MINYYAKSGKPLGKAWSVMDCGSQEKHLPHSHDSEFFFYGPYMCPGFPAVGIYDTPGRRPVNHHD